MSTNSSTREQAVDSAIREISHIATLPEITLKIIELVEDPSSTAQDLNRVISNDPALCSRILKVVNSAFYGLPGQVGSINRAIVLLGLNAVKNIAIAASLAKLFRGGALAPNFSARDLWDHSVAVGATAKAIADAARLGMSDEAFLAGLMHDIGVIVEIQFDRHKLVEVVSAISFDSEGAPTPPMLETEEKVFGANHQEFGRALCQKWKFPTTFQYTAGMHHDPLAIADEHRRVPVAVAIADRLAAANEIGFRLDLASTHIPADFLEALHVTRDTIEEIAQRVPDLYTEASQLMS